MGSGEKRKYRRVKAKNVAGHLRVKEEVVALGMPIDNISMGGLFVRCGDPLPVGTPVAIELARPDSPTPLRVTGVTVVAIDAIQGMTSAAVPGMGIRFDPLSAEASERLKALLRELVGAGAVAAPNPAQLDDSTRESRKVFDFGFVSHEQHPEPQVPAPFAIPSAAPSKPDDARRAETNPGGARETAKKPGAQRAGTATVSPQPLPARSPAQMAAATSVPPPQASPARAAHPTPDSPPSLAAPASPPLQLTEAARLNVQVRGLLQDLGHRESELARRDRDLEELRAKLERANRELERKDARIAELELRLARAR